ncbi:MAG: S-adenosylmethionine:tRNA ribosyltransferase-isomerase, partial [Clostridia bacterium]|nr:S-adenosylmethionine:tRNA ribosyltransferase-isomerase [Clostridia bacterium]
MANQIIVNEKVPTTLLTSDFDYELPEELIAQSPAERRDGSRLMVVDRKKDAPEHRVFSDVIDYLRPEDILVVNSSKVIPARLLGVTERSGGTMELLLLKSLSQGRWETLVRPGKRAKTGDVLLFGDGLLRVKVEDVKDDGNRIVSFDYDRARFKNDYELLDAIGELPLPPYIHKKQKDLSRYQTVYAK